MTNKQAPEALHSIARYKIGYHTDEWGVRSSTPGGISDPSGQWVLYKDHLAALASHGQAPAQAAPAAMHSDLRARCVELLAWRKTGTLPGETLRTLAREKYGDRHDALQWAERDTETEALNFVAAATTTQPAPQPAQVEVADAVADSQYLAGVSAGWNAANADDPNEALRKLHESRAGYLKPLHAARAPADSVTAPAGGAVAEPEFDDCPASPTGKHSASWFANGDCEHCKSGAQPDAPLLYTPTPPAQAADSVLEDAARESEYRRGYRHGYEQRDAEVRGALA